jgi:hypothetical protein
MKDALGVLFSVIAITIIIGSIANISLIAKKKEIELTNIKALNEIKDQCNYICKSNIGTNLPLKVEMYPGIYMYSSDQKICIDNSKKINCELCDCSILDYSLNLSTSFLLDYMSKHDYTCNFIRTRGGISFDCQG